MQQFGVINLNDLSLINDYKLFFLLEYKVPVDMVCYGCRINIAIRIDFVLVHWKTPYGSDIYRLGFATILASPSGKTVFHQVRIRYGTN